MAEFTNVILGLFRLPGAVTKINIICAALDSPNYKGDIIEDFEPDNQALASILKKFFRDLEIPVLSKLKENGDIDIIGPDINTIRTFLPLVPDSCLNRPDVETTFRGCFGYNFIRATEQIQGEDDINLRLEKIRESVKKLSTSERYNLVMVSNRSQND